MSFSQKMFLQWVLIFTSLLKCIVSVTLTGSSKYAVSGQPYTLTCTAAGKTILVRFRRTAVPPNTFPTTIGAVQVGSIDNKCYNVHLTIPVVCEPSVCSCVSDGGGKASEFNWTFKPDKSMDLSTWFCQDFNNNLSPIFTLQFVVPVTSVVLQNPPALRPDLTVSEGRSTTLVCVTSACRPSASVLWYIGETNYTSSSNQTVSDETGNLHITTSTLTFNPDRTMNGEIINCSVYNYRDNTVTAKNLPKLNVQYPSDNTATMNVSSVSIKEGQRVYIMCEVKGGNPKAQITWSCFGSTTTDISTSTDSRSVITMVGSSSQNGQLCTCRGQHSLVTITPAQVTFNVGFAPKNTSLSPSGQQTVTEGRNLQPIICSANCNPVCSYSWSHRGDSTTIQGAVLRLEGITRDQDKVYRCTASNIHGNKSTDVTVVVNYKPGDSVTLNPRDNTYIRNENDVLPDITCEADCKPRCSYVWMLPSNNNETGPVLSLSTLKRDEQGKYTCVARNVIGESVKTVSVMVQYGPRESIALIPSDVAYTKIENDFLPDISCVADCRPNCSYAWMLPSFTNTTGPVLSLSVLKRYEQGSYRCVARNVVGESLKTVTITVQYGSGTSITFNSSTPVTQIENTTLAPVECSADCRPSCTITWTYKNGSTLTNPLSLGELKRDEAGVYTCTAANIVHSRSKFFSVYVQYPPTITSLGHVTAGPNISEHSSIILRCVVESYPQPTISWFNVSGNATPLQTDSSVLVSSLTLQSATCFDTGQYICTANNGLGSNATGSIPIYVLCEPRIHNPANLNSLRGIENGERLNISVQFVANPFPKFTWEFSANNGDDFVELSNNSDGFLYFNYYQHVVYTSTAIRSKMTENDFGYYRILAQNGVGSKVSFKINVVPTQSPDPPVLLQVECMYSDKAEITWKSSFNGEIGQHFRIDVKTPSDSNFKLNKSYGYSGQDETITGIIKGLTEKTMYSFTVVAINKFGLTSISSSRQCETPELNASSNENAVMDPSIASIVLFSFSILLVVAFATGIGIRCVINKRNSRSNRSSKENISGKELKNVYESIGERQMSPDSHYQEIRAPGNDNTESRDTRNVYDDLGQKNMPNVYEKLKHSAKAQLYINTSFNQEM